MQRGDVLILVTDGFHEWQNLSGEEFGIDRIFSVVRQDHDRLLGGDAAAEKARGDRTGRIAKPAVGYPAPPAVAITFGKKEPEIGYTPPTEDIEGGVVEELDPDDSE